MSLLPADIDSQVQASRESRRQLAAMRCECGDDCAAHACETCDDFQPLCLMADTREVYECERCFERRMREAWADREVGRVEALARDHFPGKTYEESR